MNARAHLWRLFGYFRPYWPALIFAVAAHSLFGITEPLLLKLIQGEFDAAEVGSRGISSWLPLWLILLFFARGGLSFAATYLIGWASENFNRTMRAEMTAHIMRLPLEYHLGESSGVLLSRVMNHLDALRSVVTSALSAILQNGAKIIGYVALLFWADWRLAICVLIFAPPIAFVARYFHRRFGRVARRANVETAEITGHLSEIIRASPVIKAFGGEESEMRRFVGRLSKLRGWNLRAAVARGLQPAVVQLIAALGFSLALGVGIFLHNRAEITLGELVIFVGAMVLLPPALRRLAAAGPMVAQGLAAAERIFELLDYAPEKDDGVAVIARAKGGIEFQNVSFAYPGADRNAANEINLKINAGETLAFAGPSGGGKTTLLSLLLRFYSPQCGRILLDGRDIAEVTLGSLRAQFALVSQEIALFNDTAMRNISYPDSSPDSARARQAAARAQALDFINALPKGMETEIGEGGASLSGGQRQRLALARAFYKDAPILLLDEPTSALDSRTEAAVRDGMAALSQNRTVIVIAHRLSTIERADKIAVMEGGRIIAVGKHSGLISECPLYAEFYRDQAMREKEEEGED